MASQARATFKNLFVNWEKLGSTASDQHSKNPNFEFMSELGKLSFTLEIKINNLHKNMVAHISNLIYIEWDVPLPII